MEILLNKDIYCELKDFNSQRRQFFVENILSFFDPSISKDFDNFIEQTKNLLKKDYGLDLTTEEVTSKVFKDFSDKVNAAIWSFLKTEDKRLIKKPENIEVTEEEAGRFINWGSEKIIEYTALVKKHSKESKKEDVANIYAYLARKFGWTFEHMREMDEIDLIKALERAIEQERREFAQSANSTALATAFVKGSKEAKAQLDKINKELSKKNTDGDGAKPVNNLTRAQIMKIMMEEQDG